MDDRGDGINRGLSIDISNQLGLKDNETELDRITLEVLMSIADDQEKHNRSEGILIVMGNFFKGNVDGMDFINDNLIAEDDKIFITDKNIKKKLIKMTSEPNDGALLLNINGKIVAAGVNLLMNDREMLKKAKESNISGGGMRHIAGIYSSMRPDILSVYIYSGETHRVGLWKYGDRVGKYYDPRDKNKENKNIIDGD